MNLESGYFRYKSDPNKGWTKFCRFLALSCSFLSPLGMLGSGALLEPSWAAVGTPALLPDTTARAVSCAGDDARRRAASPWAAGTRGRCKPQISPRAVQAGLGGFKVLHSLTCKQPLPGAVRPFSGHKVPGMISTYPLIRKVRDKNK